MKDDLLIGQGSGVINTTDTTPVTGINAYAIQILATTTFASLTEGSATGSLAGVALGPQAIFGNFTSYTLEAGGAVRAYLR